MKSFQAHITTASEIEDALSTCDLTPDLILAFGSSRLLGDSHVLSMLSTRFPRASICGCTTSGEISFSEIHDDSLVLSLLAFEKTRIHCDSVQFSETSQSFQVGEQLGIALLAPNLTHVLVLSDGLFINGSALVAGLRGALPKGVSITGGLAGDGDRFADTKVLFNGQLGTRTVVGIGFYGESLTVGFGSLGGWDPFGPSRLVTRAEGNILFELDGKPALEVYTQYLGALASNLPSSGLLFPLSISVPDCVEPLVRTILGIDRNSGSITFASEIPTGCVARLMTGSPNRLVEGAAGAANLATIALQPTPPQFAILISCVGRRLVLKQQCEDEIDAVRAQLGSEIPVTGFYSYGEIAPFIKHARSDLHNQTMTVTALAET